MSSSTDSPPADAGSVEPSATGGDVSKAPPSAHRDSDSAPNPEPAVGPRIQLFGARGSMSELELFYRLDLVEQRLARGAAFVSNLKASLGIADA